MSETRRLFIEALNPLNKIANSIVKKLNYIETSLILEDKDYEHARKYLNKTAMYHSNAYNELDTEQKEQVLQKVWNTLNDVLGNKSIEESDDTEELEQRIYNFLKSNGGILYPLETSAKKLAKAIKNKE